MKMGFGLLTLGRRQSAKNQRGAVRQRSAYLGAWTPHRIWVSLEGWATATFRAAKAVLTVQQPAELFHTPPVDLSNGVRLKCFSNKQCRKPRRQLNLESFLWKNNAKIIQPGFESVAVAGPDTWITSNPEGCFKKRNKITRFVSRFSLGGSWGQPYF